MEVLLQLIGIFTEKIPVSEVTSASEPATIDELVWNCSVPVLEPMEFRGQLFPETGEYTSFLETRDSDRRDRVECRLNRPAARKSDSTWISIERYEAVVDKSMRSAGIAEWIDRLIVFSGQKSVSDGFSSFHLAGRFKGELFALYAYHHSASIHISGKPGRLDVNGLRVTLWMTVQNVTPMHGTEPTPSSQVSS